MARPAHKLFRLIYHSRQTPSVVADLDTHVRAIIQVSIRNNRNFQLSGLLLTIQGHFLQALEGPEAAVRAAYSRIAPDPRHDQIAIISSEAVETRLFREWDMCACGLTPADAAILDVLGRKGPFDLARLAPKGAADLPAKVAEIQRRMVQPTLLV